MRDPALFGSEFGSPSWATWRVLLGAAFALPIGAVGGGEADLDLFRGCTGRGVWPTEPSREMWLVCGRRAGKSRVAAMLAVFLAVFADNRTRLVKGERGVVAIVAADRRQAQIVLRFVRALLAHPLLAPLVATERAEGIDLRGDVTIEVHTASWRTSRGYTLLGCVLDEIAFWRDETTANPDSEIVAALRPGLATTGGLLVAISSPYARSGALFNAHARHFGRDGAPVFVWQAPSRTMNPTLDAAVVEEALAEDESAARAEWLAEFRSDLESFVDRGIVEGAVIPGRVELPPRAGVRYTAFVDPSGGRADSFTLCIGHREGDRCVIDVLRERKAPFSPDAVVAEFASLCRTFGLPKACGDKYAAAWVEERFSAHGIRYERAPLSKSELYAALLPQLNSGRVELLDVPALVGQLVGLERRTARGTGRDSIDHTPGARDDLANAVAGAVFLAAGRRVGAMHSFSLAQLMREPNFGSEAWLDWRKSRSGV